MRQTPVMIKKLLLSFSTFLLFTNFLAAQIDYLNGNDPSPYLIECDNFSGIDAIQDLIDDQIAGNNPLFESPGCDPVDVNITTDYNNNMPYNCGDVITVEFMLEDQCGNTETLEIDFEIEDTMDPVDFSNDPAGILVDPSISGIECDPTTLENDIQDWIDDIEANGANTGVQYFSDNCMDPADIMPVVNNVDLVQINPVVVDFTNYTCPMTFTVEVDFMDDCTNTFSTQQYTYEFDDSMAPMWQIADGDYDETVNPCEQFDPANGTDFHENAYVVWYMDVINDMIANNDLTDCTDLSTLVWDVDPPDLIGQIDFEACDDSNNNIVFEQMVEFKATDLCGNESIASTHTWTLIDDVDPVLDIASWTQATPFPECDDLASIEAAVLAALLTPGVIVDGCADISNLDINDFNFPNVDPTNIDLSDLDEGTFGTQMGCYEISIDVEYEDPCGNTSTQETFVFMIDDNNPPDIGGFDVIAGSDFCPDELQDEQDVLDEFFDGTRLFLADLIGAPGECIADPDDFVVNIVGEYYPTDCNETGYVEYKIEDECGNLAINGTTSPDPSVYRIEWEANLDGATTPLQWISGEPSNLPPGDITIIFNNTLCTNDFDPSNMFNDMWTGALDGETVPGSWAWEVRENMEWEGGCDVEIHYSHVPSSSIQGNFDPVSDANGTPSELIMAMPNSVLTTTVCVFLFDRCVGVSSDEYCFDVTVQCGDCGVNNNILCAECTDAQVPQSQGGCKLCDPQSLADGYTSCTPPCGWPNCPIQPAPQPGILCNQQGIPNNMSWFAFVASAENTDVTVQVFNCIGTGVQSGIYTGCNYDECVGFSFDCANAEDINYNANFEIGQTYYLFVDGCSGSECEYTVTVEGLNELIPDEMDAITAVALCDDEVLTDDFSTGAGNASVSGACMAADVITVCPGQEIQFNAIHQGNSGNFPGYEDPCDNYSEFLDAEFQWSSSWGETWEYNPFEQGTGEFIDVVTMPLVDGPYDICLDFIDYDCFDVAGPVCLDIMVVTNTLETFTYDICAEELEAPENPGGWNPVDGDENWAGTDNVTLSDIDGWPERPDIGDGYRCMDWIFQDACCEIPQELCIRVQGQRLDEKNPVTLYLWECQVTECEDNIASECEPVPYEWIWDWNADEFPWDLYGPNASTPTVNECIRVYGYHENEGWDRGGRTQFCDTIPQVTVLTAQPELVIDTLGCGLYCLDLDQTLENFEEDFEEWPLAYEQFSDVSFVSCATGDLLIQSDCILLNNASDDVCINVFYTFDDGAWWDGDEQEGTYNGTNTRLTECNAIYGPFDWGVNPPNAPTYTGDDTFCATALLNHGFEITLPNPELTYDWNSQNVAGVVVTDNSPNNDGSIVSIDLPAGWSNGDCLELTAEGACGPSAPTVVCFTLSAPPTVMINPIDDVCRTGAPDGTASMTANVTANAMPAGNDYTYTWTNSGTSTTTLTNSTTFSFPTAGTQSITVMVTDTVTGCSSELSAAVDFEVIEPLEAPTITCSDQGEDNITFSWTAVPGATSYILTANGNTTTETGTSANISGLALDTDYTATIIASGGAPCFNSAEASVTCPTQDCPQNGVIQDNAFGGDLCTNDPNLAAINLADAFDISATNGTLMFTSTPAGVTPAGMFDPANLPAGSYTITAAYNYGDTNQCNSSFTLSYNILDAPDPSFMFAESIICVEGSAMILGAAPNLQYETDGGSFDVNGNLTWTAPGTYTVQALAVSGVCSDSTTQTIVVEPVLEDITISCTGGLSFVNFDWNDVTGATGYDLIITDPVNGTTNISSHPVSEYPVNGLNENDNVEITVIALSSLAGCNSMATEDCDASACDPYPTLVFQACDEVPGMVTFFWDGAQGIDSFYVYDDTGALLSMQDTREYTVPNLGPQESATISVVAIHPMDGCFIDAVMETCTAPCPDPIIMTDVSCGDAGITFVSADWDDITGVTQYVVSTTINGGPAMIDTIGTSDTTDPKLDYLNNLVENDEVVISVYAINPDTNCDDSDVKEATCTASSCDVPDLSRALETYCWDPTSGPITLSIGDVFDGNGTLLDGTIEWDDNDVDPLTGEFTPDADDSDDYELDFTWTDTNEPVNCQFDGSLEVQINIEPVVNILPIAEICEGASAIIEATPSGDNAASPEWDFGGGTVVSGSDYGPYEVQYDTQGDYTVELTISSAGAPDDCSTTDTAIVTVGTDQIIDIQCPIQTNSSVVFQWEPVDGAFAYSITIDGVDVGPSINPLYQVTNISGSVDIEVVTLFDPPRPCGASGTLSCSTSACPQSEWNTDSSLYSFDAGCINEAQAFTLPGAAELLTGAPTTPIVSQSWVGDPSVDETNGMFDPSAVVFPAGSGEVTIDIVYSVTYSDGTDDCAYTENFSITVYDQPAIVGITPNPEDCILQEIPTITIEAAGGTEPYTYEWANNPPSQDDPVYQIPSPGNYDMVVTDANGCRSEVVSIPIMSAPDPEVVIEGPNQIFVGETGMFEYVLDDLTLPVNSVVWYIDDVPVALPPDGDGILEIIGDLETQNRVFEIRVEVYFSDDCFVPSDIRIIELIDIEKWYIPNSISFGAGDDENRNWSMFTKGGVGVRSVSVYDRWGELVYIKNLDPMVDRMDVTGPDATGQQWDLGWQGRWGIDPTKAVEPGVYVYVIELIVDEGGDDERPEIEAGDITVFR